MGRWKITYHTDRVVENRIGACSSAPPSLCPGTRIRLYYPQVLGTYPQSYPMQYQHQGNTYYNQHQAFALQDTPPGAPQLWTPRRHQQSTALPWAGFQQGQGGDQPRSGLNTSTAIPCSPYVAKPPTYQVKPLIFEGSARNSST